MLIDANISKLHYYAYCLIEAIQSYCTYRNDKNRLALEVKYKSYIYHCGDMIGRNLHAEHQKVKTVSMVNRDTTIQWVIGLTKAIREENNEQIDSCARSLVQIMKGNLDV